MKKTRKRKNDVELISDPDVYEPAEDSFLLARNLLVNEGDRVLDMGTGSGILAITAFMMGAGKVVASDINSRAIEIAKANAERNGADIEFVVGDLFENINGRFDLIVFNFPYLPVNDKGSIGKAWSENGVVGRFFRSAKEHLEENGRIEVLLYSLTNVDLSGYDFKFEKIASEKLFFEEIFVLAGRRSI